MPCHSSLALGVEFLKWIDSSSSYSPADAAADGDGRVTETLVLSNELIYWLPLVGPKHILFGGPQEQAQLFYSPKFIIKLSHSY